MTRIHPTLDWYSRTVSGGGKRNEKDSDDGKRPRPRTKKAAIVNSPADDSYSSTKGAIREKSNSKEHWRSMYK